jgi:hypothetical protein
MLSYLHSITNKISQLLAKCSIKTIYIPARKNIHMLRYAKDKLELKVPVICCIPCECGKITLDSLAELLAPDAKSI